MPYPPSPRVQETCFFVKVLSHDFQLFNTPKRSAKCAQYNLVGRRGISYGDAKAQKLLTVPALLLGWALVNDMGHPVTH